jgi:hypothetical protein
MSTAEYLAAVLRDGLLPATEAMLADAEAVLATGPIATPTSGRFGTTWPKW